MQCDVGRQHTLLLREEGRMSLSRQRFKQSRGLTGPASLSTHQVDEVLVADPPLGVAVCQGQEDL